MRGGSDGGGLVQFGIDAQGELAGKMLARIDAILGTGFEEHAQRDFALAAQAIDILGIKVGAAVQPDELPRNIWMSESKEMTAR